jgi:hypothetical protein
MRSALPKPPSLAMVSTDRTVCSSLQRAASARARSANCAGVSPVSPKEPGKIARAHGHAIRQGGYAEIVPRMPQDPGLKFADVFPVLRFRIQIRTELGLPPGAPEKNYHCLGDRERDFPTEIFLHQDQSQIDPSSDSTRGVDIPVTREEEAGIDLNRRVFRREDI